jgi:hypothetical protein
MKLRRQLHLEVSRKLQSSVRVKVFAYRSGGQDRSPQRVCLGTLHMPEEFLGQLRTIIEAGSRLIGATATVGGSYFEGKGSAV